MQMSFTLGLTPIHLQSASDKFQSALDLAVHVAMAAPEQNRFDAPCG